jgi:hypothetical protein
MSLSLAEIKMRAIAFFVEWANETSEDAEAKSFWDAFFNIFGISRRRVAAFEQAVKKLGDKQGYIDLFWTGVLLIEHKSRGKNLDKAFSQATEYFHGLKEYELPKYVLVSDFQRFCLHDLDSGTETKFELKDLTSHLHLFDFMTGREKRIYKEEDPINIEAAQIMGKLHDSLKESGYGGHDLEVLLVRLLFCLFADDTGIFQKGFFWEYIETQTKENGADVGMYLNALFQTLDTPKEKQFASINENLAQFPYINGKIFKEILSIPSFNRTMREMLLEACGLDWSKISPAIFGSMFQSVMNPKERRNLGAHYTSEKNILKVIKSLFLDDLYAEYEKAKTSKAKLHELHEKIANLRFFDPACGCGNFLIISYRELREVEIQILRELNKSGQGVLDIQSIIKVDVDQFYGIEYDEFAVRVAEVAMWLIDHQMNLKVGSEFGKYFNRLPLTKSALIVHGNSLQIAWGKLLNPLVEQEMPTIYTEKANIIQVKDKSNSFLVNEPAPQYYKEVNVFAKETTFVNQEANESIPNAINYNYILGNPPFIGKSMQNEAQKADMERVFNGVSGAGVLDYVCAWYLKAAKYIQNTTIKCAFVSTNSIAQGEQVGVLWNLLFNTYKIKIHFAHRTFKWTNEASGNAAVHCVIIGFSLEDVENKQIFDYADIKGEAVELKVKNINPYLIEGNDLVILKRSKPISNVPEMLFGSKIVDNGNYLFTDEEKKEFIKLEPNSKNYFRPALSGDEFINGKNRWCLYLENTLPNDLSKMPHVLKRVENVKEFRKRSIKIPTQNASLIPTLFAEIRQPKSDFLLIPLTSSENRKYIPMAFFDKNYIVTNSCSVIQNASLYLFGILTSQIHMIWVKYTCGRLKSDYRYSNTIVYNNFPFPQNNSEASKKKVEAAAQLVLDARAKYPESSLADLYGSVTMPPALAKAHLALDKAVDLCYRPQPFVTDLSRIEFLFNLYESIDTPMFKKEKKRKKKSTETK